MYQTHKVYVQKDMVFSDLIIDNPSLLMVMEFFGVDDLINDHTVESLCEKNTIDLSTFLVIVNLYNGFHPNSNAINSESINIKSVIKFLRRTHLFYIHDKYPEIQKYINQLYEKHNREETARLELFFNDYFNEVLEHLKYEDEVAFPYFIKLLRDGSGVLTDDFSGSQYRDHHTDIETKLSDLKNLLVKHISIKDNFPLKRRIITSIFELESDLMIHSMIEEHILLPLVEELEKKNTLE